MPSCFSWENQKNSDFSLREKILFFFPEKIRKKLFCQLKFHFQNSYWFEQLFKGLFLNMRGHFLNHLITYGTHVVFVKRRDSWRIWQRSMGCMTVTCAGLGRAGGLPVSSDCLYLITIPGILSAFTLLSSSWLVKFSINCIYCIVSLSYIIDMYIIYSTIPNTQ